MCATLSIFPKNGLNKILIFVIIFLTKNSLIIDCSGKPAAAEFDVLAPIKPIKKYVEFGSYFQSLGTIIPDYKFRIDNISRLIPHRTELLGGEFTLPAFNCSAQIKCSVRYDDFQLAIRFLQPGNEGKKPDWRELPLITFSVTNYGNPQKHEENLRRVFPFDLELVYGTFYPIFSLSYDAHIKNEIFYYDEKSKLIRTNYLALQLHVQEGVSGDFHADDGVFLWKVDVSGVMKVSSHQHEFQLAMSPFISNNNNGFRVQLRLFLKDSDGYVAVGWFNSNRNSAKLRLTVTLVHPTESKMRIIMLFEDEYYTNYQRKASRVLKLATVQEMANFFTDNKLLVAVEIQ